MAKLSKDEILKAVEEMSVLELSDLVKALEEKFGVTALPAVASAQAGATGASASEEPKEEQTVFNVVLTEAGANKIGVIKAVREIVPTLGLQEAKTLVESAPKEVLTGAAKSAAEEAKKKLEAAGAKVELK
jgi:large subunit ribosomal protein L7/L12